MTTESDTFDFVSAARRIGEAAMVNEESVEKAIIELRKTIVGLQRTEGSLQSQQNALPAFVAAEVDRKLDQTVSKATAQVSARFDRGHAAAEHARSTFENAAERAQVTFDDAAKRVQKTVEAAHKSLSINFMWHAFACFLIGCVGMVAGVWLCAKLFIPPADILQQQRDAQQALAILAPSGGKSVLGLCDDQGKDRRCVRTDETSTSEAFGRNGQTYRIIYGY